MSERFSTGPDALTANSGARSLAIAVALFVFAACWLLIPVENWASPPRIYLPEQIEATTMIDTLRQRVAYLVWVGLIVLTCLCILLRPRRK